MLRMLGFDNVYSMKFGMTSWHADFDSWSGKLENTYVADFETVDNPKGPEQTAPKVDTGNDKGRDILKAQVKDMLATGFGDGAIGAADVVPNAEDYFIINYWPMLNVFSNSCFDVLNTSTLFWYEREAAIMFVISSIVFTLDR